MTQILNFILKHQPPTWPEFEEICPDGGVIPDCEIRVDPDYWGIPPPTETYGALEVINCPMESLTAKCGASVSVWMRPGCPAETPNVVCDTVQNPTEIDPDSSESIFILDGYPPYVWEIVGGHGFSLEWESTGDLGGRPDERLNSRNILYASPDSCGTAQVKIKDNCGTEIVCDFDCEQIPVLEYDWVNSAQTVVRNTNVDVFVTGGSPPYTWNVSGVGFAIHSVETYGTQNTIYADSSACGPGIITVEDVCGVQIEGSIRCTAGQWVEIEHTNNGDEACGLMRGVGVDYHNTWSSICDSGGCYESWRGRYHVYEEAQKYGDSWGSNYCTRCDVWIPNGCVVCLMNAVPTCHYAKPYCTAGSLPNCYCYPKYHCFAMYKRWLEEWKCP